MALSATVGALSFPLADTGASTLADMDVGRDILLALMKAALNYELATRWGDAVVGTTLGETDSLPVESIIPFEPDIETLQSAAVTFPLLCCYRTGDVTIEPLGVEMALMRQSLVLEYILTPWSPGTERKLADIFRAVVAVAHEVVRAKGHTAYATDAVHTTQAKLVLDVGTGNANFHEIKLTSATFGKASFSQNAPAYNACRMVFSVSELITDTSDDTALPYLGMTLTHDLGTALSHIDGFVGAETNFPDPTPT